MSSLEQAGAVEGVEEEKKKDENDDQHSVTETEKEEEVSSCDEGSEDVGFDDIKVDQVIQTLQRSYVLNEKSGRLSQRFTCLKCKKVYPMLYSAVAHVRVHFETGKPLNCKRCKQTFSQINSRYIHLRTSLCAQKRFKKAA